MKACLAMLCMVSFSAFAADSPEDFHRAVYALHEQQIAQREIRVVEEKGKYEGVAAAGYRYVDTGYYDSVNGLLLSRVRRDAAMPEYVHSVEVYIYENGRLVRDFGSITLPWAPTQPVRTFINLHHYNDKLHSLRQYNFFGQVGYESCKGEWAGKPVRISLDESDINTASTGTPEYKACFDGMSTDWAQFKMPH